MIPVSAVKKILNQIEPQCKIFYSDLEIEKLLETRETLKNTPNPNSFRKNIGFYISSLQNTLKHKPAILRKIFFPPTSRGDKIFESKPRKTWENKIICICWGEEHVFNFKNFFLRHLIEQYPKEELENLKLSVATDVVGACALIELLLQNRELKKWNFEILNYTDLIYEFDLNNFEKLGLIFQDFLKRESNTNKTKKVFLINPDQTFSETLFNTILKGSDKYSAVLTAPLRCDSEDIDALKQTNPHLSLEHLALKSLHKMQGALCVSTPWQGRIYSQKKLPAQPWGWGYWASEKTYLFKAYVFAMCALNLEKTRKQILEFSKKSVAPDIGFLEMLNLQDEDILWVEKSCQGVSVDVSPSYRSVEFYLGEGDLLKLLASHFAFWRVTKINKLCFNKTFVYGSALSPSDKKKHNLIMLIYYWHFYKKKMSVYLKYPFRKSIRQLVHNYKNS